MHEKFVAEFLQFIHTLMTNYVIYICSQVFATFQVKMYLTFLSAVFVFIQLMMRV